MNNVLTRYHNAASLLPPALRAATESLPADDMARAEEFRLRLGRPFSVTLPEGELRLPVIVEQAHLEALLETASRGSLHTVSEQLRAGYITVRGGHRVGLTGTAVLRDGMCAGLRDVSSAAVRIAKEVRGVAEPVMDSICPNGAFQNTLILSPPGGGKTTLLRDIIRRLSTGGGGRRALRVGLADERGEVAALWQGRPSLDVGLQTDVLEGGAKAESLLMLLKSMTPQVIAVDEITSPADAEALRLCLHCGARLLATLHADVQNGVPLRGITPALREMFTFFIVIEHSSGARRYHVVRGDEYA